MVTINNHLHLERRTRDANFNESDHPRKDGQFTAGGKTASEHNDLMNRHDNKAQEARQAGRTVLAGYHKEAAGHHAAARNNLENAGAGGTNPSGRLKIAEGFARKAETLTKKGNLKV